MKTFAEAGRMRNSQGISYADLFMRRLLIGIIFYLVSFSSFSQAVYSGQVRDAQTRVALSGVNVVALPTEKGTVTDVEGKFSLQTDADVWLRFSYVGYQTREVQITPGDSNEIITLEPTARQLTEVVVVGYENNRKLVDTPGSVALLTAGDLNRFSNTSPVPALNTVPGVRIEERSPGSYRLSIRGSLLRSPFGVRNVKVYWNDLPFTDPSGNTPLNLLDFSTINRVEIIKGPAGSIYGAGTGGVVLLQTPVSSASSVQLSGTVGSFGLRSTNLKWQSGGRQANTTLTYAHQQSDGYRNHSALRRDVLNLRSQFVVDERRTISLAGFYSDVYYQTPGGITAAQVEGNPKLARQPVINQQGDTTVPGSEQQRAAIYQQTLYLGVSQEYRWNDQLSNTTSLYGTFNQFRNPFITNYERRADQGLGGRTKTTYQFSLGSIGTELTVGGEFQRGFAADKVYGNRRGTPDTLQIDDEITTTQYILFGQATLELPANFLFTLGGSYNRLQYNQLRLSDVPVGETNVRRFDPVISPRVALVKKLNQDIALHGSVSYGFAPPTLTEILPSEGTFNTQLAPERGVNYEIGFRGNVLKTKFTFDVAAYAFRLRETIVRRTTEGGAEYFVNAGQTRQNGLEAYLAYQLIDQPVNAVSSLKLWTSGTFQEYTFVDYAQGEDSFSGNHLTGVPPTVVVTGVDAATKFGLYTNITFNFTDFIPLNDANTVYANDYALLGARLGFRKQVKNWQVDVFGGMDNALNEQYSLGNDLNAFGGRYFNPAATRNYYGGASVKWMF